MPGKKDEKGFTMMEVLAAIFIITMGMMGVFSLVQQAISFITVSSSRLVATYLAQEGIEIARNIRDGNWLEARTTETAWDDGLSAGEYYSFDYRSQTIPDSSNCYTREWHNYLEFDGSFYSCSCDSNAKFQRKIKIVPVGADILEITVEVSWQERGRIHQVKAREDLYQWH
jgi:prepilin-type N-terminal cleavage/methylation domain-containing protein